MRIIINVEEVIKSGVKTARARIGWQSSSKDGVRISNCGMEIYNALVKGFTGDGFKGGEIVIEGERK